jgi:hypothetical protein
MSVVNLGLSVLGEAVAAQGTAVVQVDWRPPAAGDAPAVARSPTSTGCGRSTSTPANAEVLRRLDTGVPMLVDVRAAADVVPGLGDRTLLHPGPPIAWDDVCDPLRRSMRAAVVAEGWASDVRRRRYAAGDRSGGPRAANEHATVVPMATALGPSMPVWVVENAPMGPGRSRRSGRAPATSPGWAASLRQRSCGSGSCATSPARGWPGSWTRIGPVDVFALAAQGVQMGDDVHMRTQASTNLLIRSMLPAIPTLPDEPATVAFCEYLSANHLFFLTLAMAGAKSLTLRPNRWRVRRWSRRWPATAPRTGCGWPDPTGGSAHRLHPSRTRFSIPGTGRRTAAWTSATARCWSWSAWAARHRGSPAVAAFLGGSMADAARVTEAMRRICAGESSRSSCPRWTSAARRSASTWRGSWRPASPRR